MTPNEKTILRKIIYAVETGGQVYGKCDYGDFTEAYTNSSSEQAITIGAGQWYGDEARRLLLNIRSAGGKGFTDELLASLDMSWDYMQARKDSGFARAVVSVITTETGKACQDELMDAQLEMYIREARSLEVTDSAAQAMCVNWRHQGGLGAVVRLLQKCGEPYTLDRLYAACQSDTGNQVGAYKARQAFVYRTLKEMFGLDKRIEKSVSQMEDWAKDDAHHGYDQIFRWGEKGDFDCSAAIIEALERAGIPAKSQGATFTGNMRSVFLKCGFEDATSKVNLSTGSGLIRGDVLLNEKHHTAMYCGDGKEVEASINEKGTATGGKPGDQTGKEFLIRSYRNYPWDCVLRFVGGGADSFTSGERTKVPLTAEEVRYGDKCQSVWVLRTILRGRGYRTKDGKLIKRSRTFDSDCEYAVRCFQEKQELEVDGIVGKNTWKKLTAL